jgi:hypothetical protein
VYAVPVRVSRPEGRVISLAKLEGARASSFGGKHIPSGGDPAVGNRLPEGGSFCIGHPCSAR